MRFYLKKFFCVCVLLLFVFVGWSFSYEANTWNTDFSFAGGAKDFPIILLGGDSRVVPFYLTNNSDATISGNFDVVDAIEMSGGLRACKANGQNEIFGQYGTFEQTGFSLAGNSRFSGSVTLKFPEGYSGEYLGCITYTPFGNDDGQSINPQPRKALFLRATLSATASSYQLKVFPGNRRKADLASKGEIRFISQDMLLVYSTGVTTNSSGIAEFSALIPDGVYYVVYKGQSHLASYLSGVIIEAGSTINMFDFTTGSNLLGVQNFTNSEDNGFRYQIAGDLKSVDGKYDFTVNGNDIAIIKPGYGQDVDDFDPRDLNGDNKINVSDYAIIGANFEQQDVFFKNNTNEGLRFNY